MTAWPHANPPPGNGKVFEVRSLVAGPTRRVGRGWSFSSKGGTITEKPRQMAEPFGEVQDIWLQSVGVVIVWRNAQHDVETRRQFADAGVFDGGEVDGDRVARGLIADA